jgi:ligand-binding sensor domain-containing protein/signal transduction histidine kinase/DNA-binding response OmpR family regulator
VKKLSVHIFLYTLLFLPFSMQGEASYYFRHFGVENGLPQNTVACISQDRQGFMWFGTKDGLSRYDGYTFRNFKYDKEDKNSIGNNFIRSIYQAENGDMWVGTDIGVYIYHPDTENFTRFDLQTPNGIAVEKEVNDIKVDKLGNIWFAVDWQGVFCYRPQRNELIFYKVNTIVNAWSICIDRENNVWIGTHGGGLSCYDRKNDRFETIRVTNGNEVGNDIYCLFQDNYNDLLIGTANGGVKKLSLLSKQIKPLLEIEGYNHLFVRDIIRKSDNELCIGTESGIYIYHTQNHTVKNFCHEYFDPYSLSDNAVYSLYKDREGGLWFGTYFGGVNYYPPQYTPFELFYPQNKLNTIRGKRIREFQQDRYGDFWIGTEDGGLNYYNPQTRTFRNFMPDGKPGSIAYHNIHGLLADGDKLWVGTFTHGLNVLDIKTQKVIRHYQKTEDPHSLCDNSVFAIYKDEAGNLWFGTIYGLALYNPQQDNFTKIARTGNTFIYDIFQSYDGLLWFASFNQGLFRYNPRNEEWKVFRHDPENEKSLAHDKVISICEDSKKNLWITTEGGGFCKYNPENECFTSYTTKDGLPNDVVYKIMEDDRGKFWFTTNKGLSCLDPGNGAIKTYTLSDGLLGNQFNYKSGIKTSDGKLFFGCLNGFISFDPLAFTGNDYIPPVVITGFRLFNTVETQLAGNATGEIHLKYNQSSFSIDFAALSYTAPEKNKYAYILEGFEKDWTQLTGNNSVTYSNIPPGEYVFYLKGSNSDGKWNEVPVVRKIYIHPPFYKTYWAYAIYALFLFYVTVMFIVSYNKQQKRRNGRRLELFQNEKEKELYNAKITFFTNIAHEIRTPLSLIKGPVEHVLSHETSKEEMTENLKIIEKNTNRLLNLSNQLLDFRKMEAKGFQLNYMRSDVKQLINDVYIRFSMTARQKNLAFELHLPPDSLWADVDREAFTKIISNLFTNAIKYAQTRIVLILESPGENQCCVKVSNDGHLIPEDMKEKIFEPFFRIGDENGNSIKSGAGLGLPLARSLAELHKGKLYLDILPGQLNIFILQLPVVQDSVITVREENAEPETETAPGEESLFKSKPTVLIVEDDREMRHFLYNRLKSLYNVVKASNGKTALECLKKENVDIVVTDVMMPEMDGLQLCAEIKANVDSSHIPVIMLTAKADIKSRIEGLDAGADAYVEKPFSMEHLLSQISNIFTNRNKVKQAFINSPAQNTGSIALTKADEIFLEKVTAIIDKNLSDVNFNVDLLADELYMSRSSLHRKIKGISELTPNDFIQLVRLKKAAELLQEGSYRINEICFLVGFSSSSYFSKRFKKQFGVPPKEIKPNENSNH